MIIAVAALLLAGIALCTTSRAAIYRNEESLWKDNLAKNPDAWQAHARMGLSLFQQERYSEALYHWQRTVELKPELPEHHNYLALTYCRLNRFDEGIAEYREALRLTEARHSAGKNTVATIRTNLGNALALSASRLSNSRADVSGEAMHRYEEAIREYEEALLLEPQQPAVHRNLGILLAQLGRYQEAVVHLRAVLQIVPNEPLARETLEAIEAQR